MKFFNKMKKNMTWEELQFHLTDKIFLIGLTFLDNDGNFLEQYQTHGTVTELNDMGLLKFERKDGSVFQMPYDKETIKKAEEGEYKEQSSGEIIKNPDFIMTWEITTKSNDNLEEVKNHGFVTID